MNTIKDDSIKLQKASKRLEEIQAGNCSKEFEEKAAVIYPPETRQADAEILKERITAKIGTIAEKYQ